MTEQMRAILDGPAMPTDYFLYRLQEELGFDHPACAPCEELRPLVKHFQSGGIKMPITMPTPNLRESGFRVTRVQLQRIKQSPAQAWDLLSPDDRRLCRQLHRLCNDIRCLIEGGTRDASTY